MDLCFVIDSSGSIRDNNVPGGPDNWQLQLEFITSLVRAFTVGMDATRVGAVVFSEQVRLAFALNTYDTADEINQAILAIQYLGQTTNTPEALRVTRTQCFNVANGDRPNVPNLAVIVTDGQPFPQNRRTPALDEGRLLKDSGVTTILIGITDNIDVEFLRDLSSRPQLEGQNYFTATDFAVLNTIQRTVVQGTCTTLEGELIIAQKSFIFPQRPQPAVSEVVFVWLEMWNTHETVIYIKIIARSSNCEQHFANDVSDIHNVEKQILLTKASVL